MSHDCESAFDAAVSLLYEAVLDPPRLKEALGAMVRLVDGDFARLVGWNRASGMPTLSVSTGLAEDVGPDYAACYSAIDPRRQLALTLPPAHILACHEHFDARFVSRDEHYQDYMLSKVGVHYILGAGDLVPESPELIMLSFQRYVGHAHFTDGEKHQLHRLTPHLQRALRLRARQASANDDKEILEASQGCIHFGILALSGSGSVVSANRRGEALVRRGKVLSLRHGTLIALDPNLNAALGTKLRQAAAGHVVHLLLPDRAGQCSLCLTLMPTLHSESSVQVDRRTVVIALIADTRPHRIATTEQLMELFRLTQAEARLVRALCLDEDLDCYAAHEGLKKATVRTHLQSALAKTGTGKQKDLVRLVLSLPAVRK